MFVKKPLFCLAMYSMFNAVSFYLKIHLISQIFVCSVALLQAEACLVLNMHKNDHDLPLLVTLGTHTDSVFTQQTWLVLTLPMGYMVQLCTCLFHPYANRHSQIILFYIANLPYEYCCSIYVLVLVI